MIPMLLLHVMRMIIKLFDMPQILFEKESKSWGKKDSKVTLACDDDEAHKVVLCVKRSFFRNLQP